MRTGFRKALTAGFICVEIVLFTIPAMAASKKDVIIVSQSDSAMSAQAAQEVRRYVYLRTGELLAIEPKVTESAGLIVLADKGQTEFLKPFLSEAGLIGQIVALGKEQYRLKTVDQGGRKIVLIVGGDDLGLLYGAYQFAEQLGVRFYMHGDVVPDERMKLELPIVDLTGKPLFIHRGIQPFHDFPEGPDWWNADDYKAIFAQLPKLRMNFFGLHTYPEGGVGPEPLVWIGPKEDINADGTVKASYPARHFTTNNITGAWGCQKTNTGDYTNGADEIFEIDDYCADYMVGINPWTTASAARQNKLFNDMGAFVHDIFSYAKSLGIQTCIGTETPLTIPTPVKERLKAAGKNPADPAVVREIYEGMFARIAKVQPLDYYWFWTPEGWTWEGTQQSQMDATIADLKAAIAAAEKVKAPFTLATCGWVLGPPTDRAMFDNFLPKSMPLSCINRNVGFSFVEPGFEKIKGRPIWAIPWMEDDPALIAPQLWAGRMRRDAADALAYGCTGLMGIHWRTRILGPNVSALAMAAWDQSGWNPTPGKTGKNEPALPAEGCVGGNVAAFPNNTIADTQEPTVYQTVRYDVEAYKLKVPGGTYTVTLKFCEPHYAEKGKRVFGVKLQGKTVIETMDIFAAVGKDKAMDRVFKDVSVVDGMLRIEFVKQVEFPSIAGIVLEGPAAEGKPFVRKINCGGPAWKDYQADMQSMVATDTRPRDLPVEDFYADWAKAQFGTEAAVELAAIFVRLDGGYTPDQRPYRAGCLPRPSTWVDGPGGIVPDGRPWSEVSKEYAFVDQMAVLEKKIHGEGNLERFTYWLNQFRYLRAIAKVNCDWALYNAAFEKAKAAADDAAKKKAANELVLPLRKQLVADVAEVHRWLLQAITTQGGLGNVANWQQHVIPMVLTRPGQELEKLLSSPLPDDAKLAKGYGGSPRMFVPTVRTMINVGEPLKIRAIVQGAKPSEVAIFIRPMGKGGFAKKPLTHMARGVYQITLPAQGWADLEYYIDTATADGKHLFFPATAPKLNQTVVVKTK